MKKLFLLVLLMLAGMALSAENYKELWIVGSAVPGGAQKLEQVSDQDFKYAGPLSVGELRVSTTKKVGKQTRFLAPLLPDANIVNKGLSWCETTDAAAAVWQVVVAEDRYRFHVYPERRILFGEIFQPWGELFIAGGATEAGWKEGKMLLMTQDASDPCVWRWEGELKHHEGVEEPTHFKFQGQDRWYPKHLHPYAAGTDILKDCRLRTGGDDTKWALSSDGRYRITVNLFEETVVAEKLK